MPNPPTFSLEIHSLDEFIAFVAFLRGETPAGARLQSFTSTLKTSNADLEDAIARSGVPFVPGVSTRPFTPPLSGEPVMPPILDALAAQVASDTTVKGSAATLIRGFNARMEAAVAAALENGATAEQLAPVTAEIAAMKAGSDDLAASVAENTPAA